MYNGRQYNGVPAEVLIKITYTLWLYSVDSILQAEDGDCSDSDFSIANDAPSRGRDKKPTVIQDVKPAIAKPVEYRHAVAREALTDEWEDEIDAQPDVIRELQYTY